MFRGERTSHIRKRDKQQGEVMNFFPIFRWRLSISAVWRIRRWQRSSIMEMNERVDKDATSKKKYYRWISNGLWWNSSWKSLGTQVANHGSERRESRLLPRSSVAFSPWTSELEIVGRTKRPRITHFYRLRLDRTTSHGHHRTAGH